MNVPAFAYDPKENIIFVTHPEPVHLDSRADIELYFRSCLSFWKSKCAPRKAFVVVDYENFTFEPRERAIYMAEIEQLMRVCADTIVRYGGSLSLRAAARVNAIELHTPSNLYASRDDAIRIVHKLVDGSLKRG